MLSGAQRDRRRRLAFVFLAVALAASGVLALVFGSVALAPAELWTAVTGRSAGSHAGTILFELRLPRLLLAGAVGAVLALSGAILQGLFRNPLADPSLIGVTAGASVGASAMILLGAVTGGSLGAAAHLPLVSMGAFTGGLVTVWLVYRVATGVEGTSVVTMLLMGIAVSALAGSATGLMAYMVDNELLRRMSLWRMGGLDGADWARALASLVVLGWMLLVSPRLARALNTLLLGESQARHLGVAVERLKTRLVVLVAAGVGLSVALAGSIAFVGLVVPHMVRLWVGPDHRTLLPLSALGGAVLLVLADLAARTAMAPAELPVGLVTALLGAPFFISLLRHRRYGGL